MSETQVNVNMFNSPIETGIRCICILNAGFYMQFDLNQMLAFDHIVVHSGDIDGGPPSLHPNIKQRNGELLVRRPLVQRGLDLMECKGLLEKNTSERGITYSASELTPAFVDCLTNEYVKALSARSKWAVEVYKELGNEIFSEVFNSAFDRWTTEFQFSEVSIGGALS